MRKNLPFFSPVTVVCFILVLFFGKASAQTISKINARLFVAGSTMPLDGLVVVFDNAYSNFVDVNDAAHPPTNALGNFAILRNDTVLQVEGRNVISDKDTLSIVLWNLPIKDYRIDFTPQNLNPGLTAILIDSFPNPDTEEALDLSNGLVSKTFSVTADPASGYVAETNKAKRFTIVFAQIPPLPVRFVSISANRKGSDVEVGWKVAEEQGIVKYEVLRSADGNSFTVVGSVNAAGAASYQWTDRAPVSGNSFYRIKAIGIDGKVKYTNIAKVFAGNIQPGISVYPNPVENSQMNLRFVNKEKGRFDIQLVNNSGQLVFKGYAEHPGGNNVQFVELPAAVTRGSYRLVVTGPDKAKKVQNLFINTTK